MDDPIRTFQVDPDEAGLRLDVVVARRGFALTRSQVEMLAKAGRVRVQGQPARPGRRLNEGEQVDVSVPPSPTVTPVPEDIALEVVFEDDHVIVINKPQGMAVHPGVGRATGTLANALAARLPAEAIAGEPHRPGIVHRLDRDTSGLMVIAKGEHAYADLGRQVRRREVERRYLALTWGRIAEDHLIIDVAIGRDLKNKTRMAAVPRPAPDRRARPAHTEVTVAERLGPMTLADARIATGRTHQIRVHLAHVGHPVVGDRVYGRRRAQQERSALDAETLALVQALPGQALHAQTLSFRHPASGQEVRFSVSPPNEMADLIACLKRMASR